MNYKQILFIIVANVLNVVVANTIFEPLSVWWWVYTLLTVFLISVCSLAFEDEKK